MLTFPTGHEMAIPGMSSEQMRAALKELDQAIYNHEQWSEALFATLACRLAPDERDLSDDAIANAASDNGITPRGTSFSPTIPALPRSRASIGGCTSLPRSYSGFLRRAKRIPSRLTISSSTR